VRQQGGWGCARKLGGDRTRTAGPGCPEGYSTPQDIMLSNKSWNKDGGRGDIGSDGICLPKKRLRMLSPAFLAVAEHLPADWKW